MAFNPFHSFRRYQKTIFAGLAIVCMFIFVLSSGMGGGDIFNQLSDWASGRRGRSTAKASLYGKDIDGQVIANTQARRKMANEFIGLAKELSSEMVANRVAAQRTQMVPELQRLCDEYLPVRGFIRTRPPTNQIYEYLLRIHSQVMNRVMPEIEASTAANKKDQMAFAFDLANLVREDVNRINRQAKESFFGGDVQNLEDTLDFLIWKKKADELGIVYDKKDVNIAVKSEQLNQELSPEFQRGIDEKLRQDYRGYYNPEVLFEALTDEFRVRAAKATVEGISTQTRTQPPIMATPEEKFDWFKENRTLVRVGLIEFPVANFVAKVTDTPTETQLKDLYNKYKNDEPAPWLERPGFKEPRKVKVEWLAAQDDSPYYRKTAEQVSPVLQAMWQFGLAAADGSPLDAVVALNPAVSQTLLSGQYADFLANEAKWTNSFGSVRSAIHDSSVLRPENIAILVGASVGGGMTGAGPFSGPLALEGRVIVREIRDRAKIGASAILAAALDPAPLSIDALAMALTPPSTSEPAIRPVLAERARDQLAAGLRYADLDAFEAELAKKAQEPDPNSPVNYINEFIKTRQLEHGGMAEARDRFALPNDPGVAPLKAAFKPRQPDPLGEEFAMQLMEGPFGKPKNFVAQPFYGREAIYRAWRSEDREARAIPFDQAKPRVEAAWKFAKARELAKTEADKIAAEAQGMDAQKLRDVAARTSARLLIELPEMAKWNSKRSMTGGPTEYTPPEVPRDRVPYPGEMADKVVDMRTKQPGATTVIADQAKSAYFVAALIAKDVPTMNQFTQAYRDSMAPGIARDRLFGQFNFERQQDYRRGMMEQLRKEAKLHVYNEKTDASKEEAE